MKADTVFAVRVRVCLYTTSYLPARVQRVVAMAIRACCTLMFTDTAPPNERRVNDVLRPNHWFIYIKKKQLVHMKQ